ncbi:MAG: hypothetical protein KAT34_07795, partial [Candidatus Aminicenantes bacterium]|nr:hypothetical protein [Candidatus Aminicenantes bacterium]
ERFYPHITFSIPIVSNGSSSRWREASSMVPRAAGGRREGREGMVPFTTCLLPLLLCITRRKKGWTKQILLKG